MNLNKHILPRYLEANATSTTNNSTTSASSSNSTTDTTPTTSTTSTTTPTVTPQLDKTINDDRSAIFISLGVFLVIMIIGIVWLILNTKKANRERVQREEIELQKKREELERKKI